MNALHRILIGALGLIWLSACSNTAGVRTLDPSQIPALEMRVRADSNDFQAHRDLGTIFMQQLQYDRGGPLLTRAHRLNADDPQVRFYLGTYHEEQGDLGQALRMYETYDSVPTASPFRKLMAGRYDWIFRKSIQQELAQRIAEQDSLTAQGVVAEPTERATQTIAVFPFQYQGAENRFAPLGRGLASMIGNDLSQIDQLTVVERMRIGVLLDELALAEEGYVDEATAPRAGHILGAGRMVGGAYNVFGAQIQVGTTLQEVSTVRAADLPQLSESLNAFFQLEKDLVFRILEALGIQATPAELEKIETIPTRNLQAFLAYCRGLEAEDQGQFQAASFFYNQAVTLDPTFEEATQSSERMQGVVQVDKSTDQLLSTLKPDVIDVSPTPTDSGPKIDAFGDLVRSRQGKLGQNIGTLFVPGQDAREPATEAQGGRVIELTDPPPPPPRGN